MTEKRDRKGFYKNNIVTDFIKALLGNRLVKHPPSIA
jgi:hypothetical protein